MEEDAIYFERRAAQETIAAMKADHPRARAAHLRLARHYHDLVSTGVSC